MKSKSKFLVCFSFIFATLILFLCFSCTFEGTTDTNDDIKELNGELAVIFDYYSKAMTQNDPSIVKDFEEALCKFDEKYGSNLADKYHREYNEYTSRLSSGTSYPALTDMPFNIDGTVYLSGGDSGVVSSVISFVSPKATAGKYYHGGSLDLNKFDPTNLNVPSIQTAITKGAGYETAQDWMVKANVAVLKPAVVVNSSSLDLSQAAMDYYCDPNNTTMQYGFFANYVNIFNLVTKEDNYYWYCTKVVWRIYNKLGIDLDSNSSKIDWTTSGLYDMVVAYYYARYFYNWSLAKSKINEYMQQARKTIVLAEEIYFSPYLVKYYEQIRNP
ncbi:MAG TPA: hypothetical protein PLX16_00690 [Exilispira sp.]|nr:hypothetical protein [Spirochaetota bacterium]HOV45496.1 hypothetical protein [Exilispira sp.]HPB47108.1 hypothetical protein [Exilispira sp.]